MSDFYHIIGSIIQRHRRAGRLTQLELARIAGVGKTAVFDVEHGKKSVQLDTLFKILHVLNIELHLKTPLEGIVQLGSKR